MTRIIIQPDDISHRETIHAFRGANRLGVEVAITDRIQQDDVPVGGVPFCQHVMEKQGIAIPKPDFYPTWLHHWMHRLWAIQHITQMAFERAHGRWFVKSADEYKAYPARIVNSGDPWPDDGFFIISEVVQFTNEWRYYVADGQVVTTGWYDGDDDESAPDLGIDWPVGFCGAVDFGRLSTGELALVECHHGFACGWYGDDSELYVLWMIECWESLKKNLSQIPGQMGS